MRIIHYTKDGIVTPYTSLKPLFKDHPELNELKSTIKNTLSRKKISYEKGGIKIERVQVR